MRKTQPKAPLDSGGRPRTLQSALRPVLRSGKFAENLRTDGLPAAVHRESYVRGHAEGSGIKIVSRTETGTRIKEQLWLSESHVD